MSAADRTMALIDARRAIDPHTGCWLWTGRVGSSGYGRVHRKYGVQVQAHRFVYEAFRGPIPEGMSIDHLCRVRRCVNPDHLEPVTIRENILRSPSSPSAVNARKTHCKHGHSLDEGNVYHRLNHGRTFRLCKQCKAAANARRLQ